MSDLVERLRRRPNPPAARKYDLLPYKGGASPRGELSQSSVTCHWIHCGCWNFSGVATQFSSCVNGKSCVE